MSYIDEIQYKARKFPNRWIFINVGDVAEGQTNTTIYQVPLAMAQKVMIISEENVGGVYRRVVHTFHRGYATIP